MQPTNDGTGDDGNGRPVLAATITSVPTSDVVGGKKRSREAASSTRNVKAQTKSKNRAKLPHSTVHETSEEAGTTAQPRVLRRSNRRATTADEGTFEGINRGIEAEQEADDDFMSADEEDGPPVDDGDGVDLDEEGNKSIVTKRAQHGLRPENHLMNVSRL